MIEINQHTHLVELSKNKKQAYPCLATKKAASYDLIWDFETERLHLGDATEEHKSIQIYSGGSAQGHAGHHRNSGGGSSQTRLLGAVEAAVAERLL